MVIKGSRHEDERGILTFNNVFDASEVKRIYTIQNHFTDFIRGWQGHTPNSGGLPRFRVVLRSVSFY
ncbi:hypothetical protein [Kaistella rhinocerotis]|uniref:hypothetical protein n=1 Tax=Kaistella rhinocerotis TaxID=3026437 RepID=UPI0025534B0D|nr:hypothetical protein [Kaistella sp. Ran72]